MLSKPIDLLYAQAPKEIVATMRRWLRATPPTADKQSTR